MSALKEATIDKARSLPYNDTVYYLARIRPTFDYYTKNLVSADRNILLKWIHFCGPEDVLQDEYVDPIRALCEMLSKGILCPGTCPWPRNSHTNLMRREGVNISERTVGFGIETYEFSFIH